MMEQSSKVLCSALSLCTFVVQNDRILCDVKLEEHFPRYTTPLLARRVVSDFPALPYHVCVNDEGTTFQTVIEHTSLPHLLEHLVIDLQTKESSNKKTVFVGTTRWTDECAGKARIEVSFVDDLLALRAFRDAASYLNKAMIPYYNEFCSFNI